MNARERVKCLEPKQKSIAGVPGVRFDDVKKGQMGERTALNIDFDRPCRSIREHADPEEGSSRYLIEQSSLGRVYLSNDTAHRNHLKVSRRHFHLR